MLRAKPAFRALAQVDPKAYADLLAKLERSPHANADDRTLVFIARSHISFLAFQAIPHATDPTAHEFARTLALELKTVLAEKGSACFAFLAPDEAAAVEAAKLNLDVNDGEELGWIGRAFEASAQAPLPIPTDDVTRKAADRALAAMKQRFGPDADILGRLADPAIDKAQACRVMTDLVTLVLFREDRRSPGAVFRVLFLNVGPGTIKGGA